MGVGGTGITDRHGVVTVGAAIENVSRGFVGDAHDGVVGGGLVIIAVSHTPARRR